MSVACNRLLGMANNLRVLSCLRVFLLCWCVLPVFVCSSCVLAVLVCFCSVGVFLLCSKVNVVDSRVPFRVWSVPFRVWSVADCLGTANNLQVFSVFLLCSIANVAVS